MALHVYAYTWAHREFLGMIDPENEVTGLNVLESTISVETRIVDGVLAEAASKAPVIASVETAIAAGFGVAIFNEQVNMVNSGGIILVIGSIILMNHKSTLSQKWTRKNAA
nr:DUF6765 family protein [uncultured Anaeromusa sp.]